MGIKAKYQGQQRPPVAPMSFQACHIFSKSCGKKKSTRDFTFISATSNSTYNRMDENIILHKNAQQNYLKGYNNRKNMTESKMMNRFI